MDTVRSEYSDTSSALGTGRFGDGSSTTSVPFIDSSSFNSSRASTTRTDFLSNYEQKFLERKAEKKKKRDREKRLATSNQLTADDKRRADREAERHARKAEMATWLPTKEHLDSLDLHRKIRTEDKLRKVLRWYPPHDGIENPQQFVEVQPHFCPEEPLSVDKQRQIEQVVARRTRERAETLQLGLTKFQQKLMCAEEMNTEIRKIPRRRRTSDRLKHGLAVHQLAPLTLNSNNSKSCLTLPRSQSVLPRGSRALSTSYLFRGTPDQEKAAAKSEDLEVDAFLQTHKRQLRRERAAIAIQSMWRMVLQRRRYWKWRYWRRRKKHDAFQIWSLSHRITKQAQRSAKRRCLRAWRDEVNSSIQLRLTELRLFRDAETQPTLPRVVMNLVLTSNEDDDAYTRKVLANPMKQSYYSGFVNAAFASVEGLSVNASKNRVRLLKAQHVEARRGIARKVVQQSFLMWKRVHKEEMRIGLNAQLCIKRAARLAFKHRRPVWAAEKLLTIFELWIRWAAFTRSKRLGVPMPHFSQPLPLWDMWLHNYQERQVRKVKAATKAPLARMKRCFRAFREFAAYALLKRLGFERAVDHFRQKTSRKIIYEWRAAIEESASRKKLLRNVVSTWHRYVRVKVRLRPIREQVVSSRLRRELLRTWGVWRNVQLRSCFKRELNRARLISQPKWRWKVQRLLLIWMDVRSQLHKWKVFVAWMHYVQRRKLYLTLRAHCCTLQRKHLLYGVFGAWKAVVWKQEDEFLEDRLQLSAWDAYRELSPLLPMIFYGCYSDASAIFGGVPSPVEVAQPSHGSVGSTTSTPAPLGSEEDVLVRRQHDVRAFHMSLLQGSVVESRNIILQKKHLINAVDSMTGDSALHVVAGQIEDPVRRLEGLTLLLSEGACSWDKPNRHGLTPIQLAPDDTTRELISRGVFGFHACQALRLSKSPCKASKDNNGMGETRLVWCLVTLMSSEYVRGDRIAGEFRREWHSVLRDELWLRQGKMYFASTSAFSPAISRCRAFLNGMKRRICRSKEDVLLDQWSRYKRDPRRSSDSISVLATTSVSPSLMTRGGMNAARPALVRSATRRMLSRDLARMEEKIDLLSWLKNTPDDPTREHALDEKEEHAEQLRTHDKVLSLGEYGPYAELLISPILNDEAAEGALVHTFAGVLFSLGCSLHAIRTEASRLEDYCDALEGSIMHRYQAIMRSELRCRSPDQPMGLPLLRFFTEPSDAEFFFKRESLLIDVEIWRRCGGDAHGYIAQVQAVHTSEVNDDDELSEENASTTNRGVAQLSLELDVLLAKAERKQRKLGKKMAAAIQEVALLEDTHMRILLTKNADAVQDHSSVFEITEARIQVETKKLKVASLRLKLIEWGSKIQELVDIKEELEANRPREVATEGGLASSSVDEDLLEKREFLDMQYRKYVTAFRRHSTVNTPTSELRELHKATTEALWRLFIVNLIRCCCCWLVENLIQMQKEDESCCHSKEGNPGHVVEASSGDRGPDQRLQCDITSSAIPEHVNAAVAHSFAAARKASADLVSVSTAVRRRSSISNARAVLDTLHRSSAAVEMAEIHTQMMRETYVNSSQLLFQRDRDVLLQEEQMRKQEELTREFSALKNRSLLVGLNPVTNMPEKEPTRVLSSSELTSISRAVAELPKAGQDKADSTNRKLERFRDDMRRRQVRRREEHDMSADEPETQRSKRDRVTDVSARSSSPPSKHACSSTCACGSASEVLMDFGNFVVGVAGEDREIDSLSDQALFDSTTTEKLIQSISAEGLWRRAGGIVRKHGDTGNTGIHVSATQSMPNSSPYELFASPEDEMAFNTSFRVMSAARDRRTSPHTGMRRLSAIGVDAVGSLRDNGDVDIHYPTSENPLIEGKMDEEHNQVAGDHSETIMQRYPVDDREGRNDETLSLRAIQGTAEIENEEVAGSLPQQRVVSSLSIAPSIEMDGDDDSFFDQALVDYLTHVRRDSVPSTSEVDTVNENYDRGSMVLDACIVCQEGDSNIADGESSVLLPQETENEGKPMSEGQKAHIKWEVHHDRNVDPANVTIIDENPRSLSLLIESTRLLFPRAGSPSSEITSSASDRHMFIDRALHPTISGQGEAPDELSLSGKSIVMSKGRDQLRSLRSARSTVKTTCQHQQQQNPSVADKPEKLLVPRIRVDIQHKTHQETLVKHSEAASEATNASSASSLAAADTSANEIMGTQLPLSRSSGIELSGSVGIDERQAKRRQSSPKHLMERMRGRARRIAQNANTQRKSTKKRNTYRCDLELCLEGNAATAAREFVAHHPSLGDEIKLVALSSEQKRQIWLDFTSAELSMSTQDAYAALYPNLYEASGYPQPLVDESAAPNSPCLIISPTEKRSQPVNEQLNESRRFWSAVEGFKAVGASGLVPLDDKATAARRRDTAVAIYQDFLCPNSTRRLEWLAKHPELVQRVRKKLLMAPKTLFDDLQLAAQRHIASTLK